MPAVVSIEQLLRRTFVRKLVSQKRAGLTALSQYYGVGPGTATERVSGDSISWDIINNSRQLARGRARNATAAIRNARPVGVQSARLFRQYEKMHFSLDKLQNLRPPGGDIGTLDSNGQSQVAKQVSRQLQTFRLSHEFMFSRMLMGGFGIRLEANGDMVLQEKDGGGNNHNVEYQIPAANIDTIATVSGKAGVWSATDCPVVEQLVALNAKAEDKTGFAVTEIWGNSTTLIQLLSNTKLQGQGGSAFRVWDRMTGTAVTDLEGLNRTQGVSMALRAWPQFTFHMYDGVVKLGADTGPSTKLIPDGKILATPAPGDGDWYGWCEGSEWVRPGYGKAAYEAFGFESWILETLEPAGYEFHMVENGLPLLYVPEAVWFLTVS